MPHYFVVCAIIIYDNKILCMQRGVSKFAYTSLHWEFPGGKIEPGETPEIALHREILEEMEMDIKVGECIGTFTHEYPDFIITMTGFISHVENPEFVRREHADHKWLHRDELQNLDWCAADIPFVEKIFTSNLA